ncbi:hypothetical protein TWF217_006571 [Orbilia oligospora]|nr:hypothetical protein TWF217_006571 [Orbilia oligospora]
MHTTTCLQGYPNLILFEVSNVKEMVARVANVVQLDFCRPVGKSLQSSPKEQIGLDKTPHYVFRWTGPSLDREKSAPKYNRRRQLYLDEHATYETFKDNSVFLNLQVLYGEYENVQYLRDFEMSTMNYCSGQVYQIARELDLYFDLIGLEFGVRLRTIPSLPAAFDENRPA